MHRTSTVAIAAFISIGGGLAQADIVRVTEFQSAQFEGFENLNMVTFERNAVEAFDGLGTIFNTRNDWLHATGSWSKQQRVSAYEGDRLFGSSKGGVGYQFKDGQRSFGGFFASITGHADGEIRFFSGNELIGADTLIAPTDRSWAWNGWSSDRAFDRVEVTSNHNLGGFLVHDAVRVLNTAVPSPGGVALLIGGALTIVRRRR